MTISEFAFRLIIIFIPGIVSFFIIDRLTSQKELPLSRQSLYSLLLGFLNYEIYYLICLIQQKEVHFFASLAGNVSKIDIAELINVTGISVIIGLATAYIINYRLIYKLAWFIKVTKKFGDDTVWNFLMTLNWDWIVVREHEKNLMYQGWIQSYYDSETYFELFLRDVKVFDNKSGGFMYETEGMYLRWDKTSAINIEFQKPK